MHKRLIGRNSLAASMAIITCLACSGTDSSAPGSGGDASIGGAPTGGVTSTGANLAGGTTASAGRSSVGGAATGGVVSTGGSAVQGGAPATGGVLGTGGIVATGGAVATGGKASGGAPGTGGMPATGGTPATGGKSATGGANAGGVATGGSAATGGKSATGGSTQADTGGKATGGATSATGGGSSVSCPSTVLTAGDHTETITSNGQSRSFIVHIPTSYKGTSATPAILDWHPLGGTGSGQEGSSGWKAKCDSVGCIAVFPNSSSSQASDNSWNAGYCCDNAEHNQVNEVQFARDIITWLKANACLDAKRVYASGGSNGGGMTYRLACEASDVIAAVAPVDFRCVTGTDPLANAGSVTAANNTACKCSNLNRPITVVAWDEGQDNSIVPYNGGQTPNLATDCPATGNCVGIGFTSAQVNAQTWANFSGCTGTATTDPNNSLCKTWTSCQGNTTVSLCTNNSASHLGVYGSNWNDVAWTRMSTQSLP